MILTYRRRTVDDTIHPLSSVEELGGLSERSFPNPKINVSGLLSSSPRCLYVGLSVSTVFLRSQLKNVDRVRVKEMILRRDMYFCFGTVLSVYSFMWFFICIPSTNQSVRSRFYFSFCHTLLESGQFYLIYEIFLLTYTPFHNILPLRVC